MTRRLTTLLAALLIGSAAGVVAATGPAAAAPCAQGKGVTVVVGSTTSCDSDGGGRAAGNFGDAGHSLTYVQRQPGFVCQVDGAPASASCVNTPPADAYWGFFWSDGTSGTWTYASKGVGALTIPQGGWVAFVYQSSENKTYPGVKPLGPAPAPTKPPSSGGGTGGSGGSGGSGSSDGSGGTATARPSATGTPTPTASATPTKKATKKPSATPSAGVASPTPTDGVSAEPTTETSSETDSGSGSGSLGWVAASLAVLLVAGMGLVLWRRRVAGGTP